MSNHTLGPWLFDEESEAITTHNRIAKGITRIATVRLGWAEPFESEEIANARLIAAAPDLLEALETLSKMAESFASELHEKHPDVVAARAAIAKATEAKT